MLFLINIFMSILLCSLMTDCCWCFSNIEGNTITCHDLGLIFLLFSSLFLFLSFFMCVHSQLFVFHNQLFWSFVLTCLPLLLVFSAVSVFFCVCFFLYSFVIFWFCFLLISHIFALLSLLSGSLLLSRIH